MQVMFLMGGKNIQRNNEEHPIYLTEINGKLILERQVEHCRALLPCRFLFCVRAEDIQQFRIDAIIEQLVDSSAVIRVNGPTKGAICTALLGAQYINNKEELLIVSIDDFIDDPGNEILNFFRENHCDAGVVAFKSVHPRYSFAKQDACGEVVEVAEKIPISKNALASFYYFKEGADFVSCAMDVIRKDSPVNGAFYISQTLNEMILRQKKVGLYKVTNERFHPLKTETHLAQYLMELHEQKESK